MTTPFSAGPQAVGYLHQVRYALHALLQETREEAAVIVEGLDDIEVQADKNLVRLEQLKHHIKGSANLTDTSPDLWKTIRIWASQISNHSWDASTVKLNLVTTATAQRDTIAWYLKNHQERDVEKAHDLLLATIAKSRAKDLALRQSFAAYQALPEREQLELLRATTVIDAAVTIAELPARIKQAIKLAAPPSAHALDLMYRELEGWWFEQVVNHLLDDSKVPITSVALRRILWSITERLQEDNLPIEFAEALPESIIDPDSDGRMFVRQLQCLDISGERIKRAIVDYYRAFTQRASWIRNQLIIDDELAKYERKLIDAWTEYKLALEDEASNGNIDEDTRHLQVGRRILQWAHTEVDIRIRPQVSERFVLRGSFHILADAKQPRIHWHPRFLERLEEILTS